MGAICSSANVKPLQWVRIGPSTKNAKKEITDIHRNENIFRRATRKRRSARRIREALYGSGKPFQRDRQGMREKDIEQEDLLVKENECVGRHCGAPIQLPCLVKN